VIAIYLIIAIARINDVVTIIGNDSIVASQPVNGVISCRTSKGPVITGGTVCNCHKKFKT
jgi:hypothetical protein